MKFRYILIILNNYFDQLFTSCNNLKYGEFKSFAVAVYAHLVLVHDLIRSVLNGCKICSIEILQVFTCWFLGLKVFLVYLLGLCSTTFS